MWDRDVVIDFWAGWISGAVGVTLTQPLDTVMTRLQYAPLQGASHARTSVPSAFAFWRGALPMIGLVPAQNALLFAGYGIGQRWGGGDGGGVNLLPVFVGGCIGGVVQSFIVAPVELIKVRMQLGTTGGALACAAEAGRTLGVPALWRGLGATLGRDGVPHGVWFATYEFSKQRLEARHFDSAAATEPAPPIVPISSGAIAATAAWGVGYPFDVIKTRIQGVAGGERVGVNAMARRLLAEAGGHYGRAFYTGFGLKLLRAVPMSAIGFYAYEEAKTMLGGVL